MTESGPECSRSLRRPQGPQFASLDVPVFVAIIAAAFNLRMALVGVGPVIEDIRVDTGISSAAAGLLTTIPILCMSAFAVFGVFVIRRLGTANVVTACLVLIGAGTVLRAVMPSGLLLILATLPIGVGLALAGVALPPIVKRHFPRRAGLVTGCYVASMTFGAALLSFTVVPMAEILGGWRQALVVSAIPVAIAIPAWIAIAGGDGAAPEPLPDLRPVRRTNLIVTLALVFGLQAVPFSTMISWVAAMYRDAGWSAEHAAVTTGFITLVGVPAAILIPGRSDGKDRRLWIVAMACLVAIGVLGVARAPTTLPFLWLLMFGIGNGALFPLVLTLPVDLGYRPLEVARLTTWMLGIGYVMSAAGPVSVGVLRDLLGGFAAPMTLVSGMAFAVGVLALLALPRSPATARRD